MQADIEFNDAEVKQLMRDYHRLGEKVRTTVARRAVNAGATPILREARQEVPVDEGELKRSLGKRTRAYKQNATAVAVVGARITGKSRGFHAHLVHDGHVAADGSFVPGNPFLKRAQMQAEQQAVNRMQSKLSQEIEKESSR